MSSHKSLLVWSRSIAMVKALYLITQKFPLCELYGITSQMRRAAISIPSNIAEGYARAHDKELLHFLYISLGSASELETQLIICKEIGYLTEGQYVELEMMNSEIMKMLTSLINNKKKAITP
ncbi:four helix bundle protein [Bacteroides caecigallinarum]|uniref:four helix bundle protein n=1 Tax=Bacteroides caecigallinarum TaxID=1411144 RepID=UPI001957383A|nr:four helix bundle protein [Bacteroides caecigallinarum]MBM6881896.1 four helix bundle protein [Bacteroides caecigallinarum]